MSDSYLYYRTADTKITDIASLPQKQRINFDHMPAIMSVAGDGIGNIKTEAQLSPAGEKTYDKQEVGGKLEKLTIHARFDILTVEYLKKMRSFFRMSQVDHDNFPYGIIGFKFADHDYYDVDPSDAIGYTMDYPVAVFGGNAEDFTVTINLTLGGRNLE